MDLFTLGIILFNLYAGAAPFACAIEGDPHYKLLMNKTTLFWKTHSRNKGEGFLFSESFKDLVTRMLHFEPEQRLSLDGILDHPWMAE